MRIGGKVRQAAPALRIEGHHMADPVRFGDGPHVIKPLRRGDEHARPGVSGEIVDFARGVGRVEGIEHGARPERGEIDADIGDRLLDLDRDPVAGFYAQSFKGICVAPDHSIKFRVGQCGAVGGLEGGCVVRRAQTARKAGCRDCGLGS